MTSTDLSSKLFIEIEQRLQHLDRKIEDEWSNYSEYLNTVIGDILKSNKQRQFLEKYKISDIVWYYQSRHQESAIEQKWISSSMQKGLSSPHFGNKTPIRNFLGSDLERYELNIGGPFAMSFFRSNSNFKDWPIFNTFVVQKEVSTTLLGYSRHKYLTRKKVDRISDQYPEFKKILTKKINELGRTKKLDEYKRFYRLFDILKSIKIGFSNKFQDSYFLFFSTWSRNDQIASVVYACREIPKWNDSKEIELFTQLLFERVRLREDNYIYQISRTLQKNEQIRRKYIQRLSHNIKHPLNTFLEEINLLKRTFTILDEQMSHLNDVMANAMEAVDSNDPVSKYPVNKVEDEVFEFFRDIEHYFRNSQEIGKKLSVTGIDKSWTFKIDKGILHEIIENLVRNAIEHGGDVININVSKEKSSYVIHVRDNGEGISNNVLKSIFSNDPAFYSRNQQGEIRGIGLSISNDLAKRHGGKLTVNPKPEEPWGTEFLLTIN